MTPTSIVPYTVLFWLGYLVAPMMLVWGWTRWVKQRPRLWTIITTLSFVGFLLSTASALFAVWVIWYGAAGGFMSSHPNYSPNYGLFYRFIRLGIVLSLLGIAFSVGGVWRRGVVRWFAPASAVEMLAFWLLATTWP